MKVLFAHNYYQQPGGEDVVFAAEVALLREKGHEVIEFTEHNKRIEGIGHLRAAIGAVWSRSSKARMSQLIRHRRPDVAHFHNTFLLISPSAYYACKEAGVPVVQTLHNYRLICPGALLMRNGRVCEDCVGIAMPVPGVVHGCWRGSRSQTALVAAILSVHRWLKTWQQHVDLYIALTEFARRKFVDGGLPADNIVVKPNFICPGPGVRECGAGDYALFVGRLSLEKGLRTLLQTWQHLEGIRLKIVGDGPIMDEVRAVVEREGLEHVEVLGRRPREEVYKFMQEARFLVFPSEWYEGFPMTIAEAFACGLPVVTSRLGAMAEIVEDGRTGLLFEPGNPEDLAAKVQWAWSHPKEMAKYTAERNYEMLMEIYRNAMERA